MPEGEEERSDRAKVGESLIRLEAKIDVVLGRHEAKIDDLVRRQGETSSTLREHDSRITANALTIAETRSQAGQAQLSVQSLRQDVDRDVADAKRMVEDAKPKNIPVWISIGVSSLAVVLVPILSALMSRK
jgi:VIT1/CCC1 family predicted Fe2+/Mn2+ transporter